MLWGRFVLHQDLQTPAALSRRRLRPNLAACRSRSSTTACARCSTARILSRPHRLQSHAARIRPPLRLPAEGLQGVSGQDEGQGRASVPLHPRGLLPRPPSFRNLDDLNPQFRQWLDQVANVRIHATTRRVVAEHFAEERPAAPVADSRTRSRRCCGSSDASPATAWSRSTAISTACRIAHVAALSRCTAPPDEVRILEDGSRHRRSSRPGRPRSASHRSPAIAPCRHRQTARPTRRRFPCLRAPGEIVALRTLAFYDAVGKRLAANDAAA